MISRLIFIYILFLFGCQNDTSVTFEIPNTPRDITINPKNAFTLTTLDSLIVSKYLDTSSISDTSRRLFKNFYNSRNYQYAWIDQNTLTEHATILWNLYKEYRGYAINAPNIDSLLYHQIEQFSTDTTAQFSADDKLKIELSMTKLFFDYAFAKYIGNINPTDLQWYIPRKKVNVSALLDTLISTNNDLKDWEPLNRQYRLLKGELFKFILIADKGGWDSLPMPSINVRRENQADSFIVRLKKRLTTTSNYPASDTSRLFTQSLKDSIKVIQQHLGLKVDGRVSRAIVNELNIPVEKRVQQILINMERMRWLPRQPDSIWILANIPSFTLQVFNGDSSVMRMNIVVGTAASKTVIFSDELKYIVFSPYWNIPASIVKNEILPAIKKNPKYLSVAGMQQIGMSKGMPVIRQLPGENNALGKVKFIFPNNFNIYLHDTPSKSFFDRTARAFSHGCVRIEKPFELAKYLLRNDSLWDSNSIRRAMNSGKEKWVSIKPVPVIITYFTAWVSDDGRINFRNDIYGHDLRMAEHLFTSK